MCELHLPARDVSMVCIEDDGWQKIDENMIEETLTC